MVAKHGTHTLSNIAQSFHSVNVLIGGFCKKFFPSPVFSSTMAPGLLAPDPGYFFAAEKVPKKPPGPLLGPGPRATRWGLRGVSAVLPLGRSLRVGRALLEPWHVRDFACRPVNPMDPAWTVLRRSCRQKMSPPGWVGTEIILSLQRRGEIRLALPAVRSTGLAILSCRHLPDLLDSRVRYAE